MVKLEPDMLIETNYSGPYRIVSVSRGCTCEDWYDTVILEKKAKPRRPHIHLVLTDPEKTWRSNNYAYLNGYDEETLMSISKSQDDNTKDGHDFITILEQDKPIQKTLFD